MLFALVAGVTAARCMHDSFQKKVKIRSIGGFLTSKAELQERQPIRINFDFSALAVPSSDTRVCQYKGQVIHWNDQSHTCQKGDLLNSSLKVSAVQKTMQNVKEFLENRLNVTQLSAPFEPHPMEEFVVPEGKVSTDLFVIVTARPFGLGSTTVASAIVGATEVGEGRPIQGAIVVNWQQVPSAPQNWDSVQRSFFLTCLHEMVHVLGVSTSLMPTWRNQTTGKPYDVIYTKYNVDRYPYKAFSILHTPKVHEFAMERFGVEQFTTSVQAGVELEDSTETGAATSHPEARVYIDDFFVSMSIGPNRLTKLSFAMLEDTGWYDVKYNGLEESAWGVGRSMRAAKISNFTTESAALVFPSHYLCSIAELGTDVCSYDFTSIALCKGSKVDCENPQSDDDEEFCRMQKFIDPFNTGYRGASQAHDFILYKAPYSDGYCGDLSRNGDSTAKNGEMYGGESLCLMSTLSKSSFSYSYPHGACHRVVCNDNNTISVFVEDEEQVCSAEGETLKFKGFTGVIQCPNIDVMCGIRDFYGLLGPTPPIPTTEVPPEFRITGGYLAVLICTCIFVVTVLSIAAFIASRERKQESSEGEMGEVDVPQDKI